MSIVGATHVADNVEGKYYKKIFLCHVVYQTRNSSYSISTLSEIFVLVVLRFAAPALHFPHSVILSIFYCTE